MKLPQISASQLKKSGAYDVEPGCWRRWAYNYLEGRREPSGPAAEKGKAYHAEMEAWNNHGVFPKSKPAVKALKYAPAPGVALAESQIQLRTRHTQWNGFIDLHWLDHESGNDIIRDWKFTGSLRNAKTAEYLQNDAAAVLYSRHAYEGGAEAVVGSWVYVEMNDKTANREVRFEMPADRVASRLDDLDHMAKDLHVLYAKRPNTLDLPRNEEQCFAFKVECPFMAECQPMPARISMPRKAQMPNDFKDDMLNSFPGGAPKAPPALPPALPPKAPPPVPPKAPPPVPTKTEVVQPPVESGFVNPPEAPKKLAASPEEAVRGQAPNKPATAPSDDLDAIEDREALKKMAVSLGVLDEKSKARIGSIRDAIRKYRLENPGDSVVVLDLRENHGDLIGSLDPGVTEFVEEPDAESPLTAEEEKRLDELVSRPANNESTLVEAESDKSWATLHTLYVNCAPVSGSFVTSAELVSRCNKKIQADHGVPDWRFVQFTGAAELNLAAEHVLENELVHTAALVIDSRTPEGAVLLDTLTTYATVVVRGF